MRQSACCASLARGIFGLTSATKDSTFLLGAATADSANRPRRPKFFEKCILQNVCRHRIEVVDTVKMNMHGCRHVFISGW